MPKRTHDDAMLTKQRILQAANKVFIEQGFEKASLSEIARVAQVTRGAIYWHFENKNDIFIELLDAQALHSNVHTTLLAAANPDERDPLGLLRTGLSLYFAETNELILSPVLVSIFNSIMASDEQDDARQRLIVFMRERNVALEMALHNAIVRHQLPSDLDVKMAATYLKAICDGQILLVQNHPQYFKRSHYLKMIDAAFNHLKELHLGAARKHA